MLSDVATTVVGLIVGVLTGYYFEWRSSRQTRAQNAELQEKLRVLRESIYAVGRGPADRSPQSGKPAGELEDEVLRWMLDYQGPDGRISRVRVVRRFLDEGFTADQVNAALVGLDERGVIVFGAAIEVR